MAIESFDDVLREVRDHPEWQAQLRSIVLTDELRQVPETVGTLAAAQRDAQAQLLALTEQVGGLAAQTVTLTQGLAALTQQFAQRLERLVEAQERTEVRLQGLAEQVSVIAQRADRAIGYLVEQQYRSKAHAYFQRIATRLHVLTPEELDTMLDAAITDDVLQAWQAEQVRWADA